MGGLQNRSCRGAFQRNTGLYLLRERRETFQSLIQPPPPDKQNRPKVLPLQVAVRTAGVEGAVEGAEQEQSDGQLTTTRCHQGQTFHVHSLEYSPIIKILKP